jgi:hypothetical protein
MDMKLDIDTSELSAATRECLELPELFKSARISALKSTAWMVRRELRDFIESGGDGTWPGLHPLSRFFAKKYNTGTSKWTRRTGRINPPLYWLGKFSRYNVEDDVASAGFGRSNVIDPFLMAILRRAESGERTTVTPSMRRFFGATRRNNKNGQDPGGTFFPIRHDTTVLETPKRPIFNPVMARVRSMIAPWFEEKFWRAVERKNMGVNNKS